MTSVEYSIQGEYVQLANLLAEILDSLIHISFEDQRRYDVLQPAHQILFRAFTLNWLRQGTEFPLASAKEAFRFYDFQSAAALARTIHELYFVMWDVFFRPKDEDDFQFSYSLWKLNGYLVFTKWDPIDPALEERKIELHSRLKETREQIENTEKFKSLNMDQQKHVLGGGKLLTVLEIAELTGFDQKTTRFSRALLSSDVHGDSLSGSRLQRTGKPEDQIREFELTMLHVKTILSKVIVDFASHFPEAKAVCEKNGEIFATALENARLNFF